MTPTVSVVIPSYNHERYLRQAIDSVLAQTRPPTEIIVVDDCSHDGSRSILAEYGHRIDAVLCDANVGTYPALNLAIERAAGEWIAILNSDDYWMPTKLQAQIDAAGNRSFVFTSGHFVDSADLSTQYQNFGTAFFRVPSGPMLERLLFHNHCYPSSVTFRRSLWERAGKFDSSFVCLGDWDLFLRMAEITEFCFVDQDLTAYRVHSTQTSRRVDQMNAEEVRIRERILASEDRFMALADDKPAMRRALAHSAAALGTQYHLMGKAPAARRMYLHSLRLNPLRGKSVFRWGLTLVRTKIKEP